MSKCVVLLSGGLDSATTAAVAKSAGFEVFALTFRYGQRHAAEVVAAQRVASQLGVAGHAIVDIDLRLFGGSALTSDVAVPKNGEHGTAERGVPATYVPARNTIFLSFALALAESIGSSDIFVGVNALDYAGYPDCRAEYIAAYQAMANLATSGYSPTGIKIHTPLIASTKAQIINLGVGLGVDYSVTRTCYDLTPEGVSCGACDACVLRLRGFAENGLRDPISYLAGSSA